jgi:hypothetical protein
MSLEKKNYDPASPIQLVNGIVTTERSGLGKWGAQSREGLTEFVGMMAGRLPRNFTMVEIGCYAGESTLLFAQFAGKVYAVDPWLNGYDKEDLSSSAFKMDIVEESFDKRTTGCTNIRKLKMTDETAEGWFKGEQVDFVYYDAIHKLGPCRDALLRWLPHVKDGGYIGGHDFCGFWGEVVDAVLESVGLPQIRTKDGSWAKKVVYK